MDTKINEELGSRIAEASALDTLRPTDKQVIFLRERMGWSFQMIAEYTGVTRQTVSRYYKRGVNDLAKALGRELN